MVDEQHGGLTQLCRNVCGYCAFALRPAEGRRAFLTLDEVLAIARAGAAAGCREALFTLGEKPELRYGEARAELDSLGFATTIDYLRHAAERVFAETGLLAHLNYQGFVGDEFVPRGEPISALKAAVEVFEGAG